MEQLRLRFFLSTFTRLKPRLRQSGEVETSSTAERIHRRREFIRVFLIIICHSIELKPKKNHRINGGFFKSRFINYH